MDTRVAPHVGGRAGRRARLTAASAALVLALAAGAAPARAQSPGEAGKAFFDRGVREYNLGNFQNAIGEFVKAYEADPAPILLFNIAQSHRQLGNKERALFFYRRYLEQEPNAPNRADVQQRMKDLAQSLEREKAPQQKPPTEVEAAARARPASLARTGPAAAPEPDALSSSPPSPRWSVAAYGGPSFATLRGRSVDLPVLLGVRVGAAYALPLDSSRFVFGVDAVVAFLPYTTTAAAATTASSSLPGFLVTARWMREVGQRVSLGGGVGAGVVWWSGLGADNPFTNPGVVVSGAIPMPAVEVDARAEIDLLPRLFIAAAPAVLYNRPTSGLAASVTALVRFELDVGAGYRF